VLLVVRLVEAHVLAELGQFLGVHVAGLAHERDQRVAGHHPHEPEHDQGRQQEHRNGQQQPAGDVLVHVNRRGLGGPPPSGNGPHYLSSHTRAIDGEPYPSVRRSAPEEAFRTCGWKTMNPLSYGIHMRRTWSYSRSTSFLVTRRCSFLSDVWRS